MDSGRVTRRRLRALLLAATGVLYALSIPWYRAGGDAAGVLFGLPDWVTVALGCYVGAAILNASAWLLTDFPETAPPHGEPPVAGAGAGEPQASEARTGEAAESPGRPPRSEPQASEARSGQEGGA